MLFPLPFGVSPSEPGLWRHQEWYLPKRNLSSQRTFHSSLLSMCLLLAELTRGQESGARTEPVHCFSADPHSPPAGPELEKNQSWEGGQPPVDEQEQGGRCWLLEGGTSGASGHSPWAGIPESSNATFLNSGLHPSAGWLGSPFHNLQMI